ncbi:MAG: FtsX-like permease family protein, partial [Bacillota bacterium]|nr:FtsX-like permease family protein [Bacillota bacterium]
KIEGQIAFKNLRRNRKRFRITVFSMVISIILYIVLGNFIGYIFDIGAVQGDIGTDFRATISGGTGEGFTDEQYNTVKALPGVEAVYKFINTYLTVVAPENIINPALKRLNSGAVSDKEGSNIYLPNNTLMSYGDAGFDQLAANLKAGSASKTELDSENGVILLQTSKFYSDINKTAVIDVTHYKVGDTINILSGDPSDSGKGITKQVKVIGILNKGILGGDFSENAGITMITTEKVYKNIIGDVSYTSMGIKLNKDADRGPVTDYLTKLNEQDPKYQFSDISKLREENGKSSIAISIFLYGFVGVITLIGCLNIINTISTNLILRKRELSMLRAVGMTRGAIKKMVAYEGILYGIVAAFYGGILGVVLSYVLSRLTTIIREFDWTFPWIQLITAIVGTIVVTLISSYIPLRKISRQNIVENIRMEE